MKLSELIRLLQRAQAEHGDINVLLTTYEPEENIEVHGDLAQVDVEQNHNTDEMFVRLSSNQE